MIKFLLIFLLINTDNASGSIFDHIFPNRNAADTDLESLPNIPYEVNLRDEKFLNEATKLIGLEKSDLDMCHQRVIMTLKKSCHEMNQEQLAKLAVMLLNCQSYSEGRRMYECTSEMTLKACTSNMDGEAWNTYHIITNRAKAVCAAIRQDQFRGLTEMTVNKLMSSAQNQLTMMKELLDDQKSLKEMTNDAFEELTGKNKELLSQQHDMVRVTDVHRSKVELNLRELVRERSLIKSGQVEVANLLTGLRSQIDESRQQLENYSLESKDNHGLLLEDLQKLHENAKEISDKIESATDYILRRTQQATEQYDYTLNQLKQINATITSLATILNVVRSELDSKLFWITEKIGGADYIMNRLLLIVIYVCYLIFGMILMSFIKADIYARMFFICALPANFAATVSESYHFDLITFTSILISMILGSGIIQMFFKDDRIVTPKVTQIEEEEDSEEEQEDEDIVIKQNRSNLSDNQSSCDTSSQHSTLNSSVYKTAKDLANSRLQVSSDYFHGFNSQKDSYPPSAAKNSTPRSITPIPKHVFSQSFDEQQARCATPFIAGGDRFRCTALTIRGVQCLNAATIGKMTCRIHSLK